MRRAIVSISALSLLLAACTSSPDTDASLTPTPNPVTPIGEPALQAAHADDTLAFFTPDRLALGVAAAGGGHHQSQSYPDPFSSDEPYRERIAVEFTSLTPENQLKWEFVHPVQGEYNFDAADAIVDFAQANGQQVRGHTLLWHSQNPSWLESGTFTDDELREILRDHIMTVVGRYAGRIQQWDVANEIFTDSGNYRTENIWIRQLGPQIVADAFRWAHEADPDAVLFLNDYSAESINSKSTAYYQLAQDLLAQGVPVHGFGVQGHLSTRYSFPHDMHGNLQRFADLGLATAVTELDIRMDLGPTGATEADLAKQADFYQRALEACLAVDTCTSFTLWGLTDTYSWVPHFFGGEGGATVTWEDFSRKPSYCALQETLAEASGRTGTQEFADRACA